MEVNKVVVMGRGYMGLSTCVLLAGNWGGMPGWDSYQDMEAVERFRHVIVNPASTIVCPRLSFKPDIDDPCESPALKIAVVIWVPLMRFINNCVIAWMKSTSMRIWRTLGQTGDPRRRDVLANRPATFFGEL